MKCNQHLSCFCPFFFFSYRRSISSIKQKKICLMKFLFRMKCVTTVFQLVTYLLLFSYIIFIFQAHTRGRGMRVLKSFLSKIWLNDPTLDLGVGGNFGKGFLVAVNFTTPHVYILKNEMSTQISDPNITLIFK